VEIVGRRKFICTETVGAAGEVGPYNGFEPEGAINALVGKRVS